ncbi:MAG TPA: BTAD domain-containing putative transcriptional regulator, partial [Gammaproteobacteria bacterium]|nr:BTAD domain-containing putative transcriptional regulator [Gammaproteobacteria bacterium]
MGTSVGTSVVSGQSGGPAGPSPRLELRLLGPLTVARDGVELDLPASRKTRALLAYLTLASGPIARSRLCDLLWDTPRDPRAELRWSLSRLRPLVDAPGRVRLKADRDKVALDCADVPVDAREVASAVAAGLHASSAARQRALLALFRGELLEGLEVDRCPEFGAWLTAQRRRFRGCRLALLERLAGSGNEDEAQRYLEQWLALAPFDVKAHETALARFARLGQLREGEEHLRAAVRTFAADGLDGGPLCARWAAALRALHRAPAGVPAERSGFERAVQPARPGMDAAAISAARRASIAVLPFLGRSRRGARQVIGDAFARDVITRLAKLRSLFVIAPGTVFALRQRNLGPEEAGRLLNVDYVAAGYLHRFGRQVRIAVDLVETRSSRVIWTETFERALRDTLRVLDETCDRIVAEIAGHIELVERNRALLKPPSS